MGIQGNKQRRADDPADKRMDRRNIVLIGPRCSGKSSVGGILAEKLSRTFLDTDHRIETMAGCPIETLVSEKGWVHFRRIEKRVVEEIAGNRDLVVATGGGVILDEENTNNLRKNGLLVWLRGDPGVLQERFARDWKAGRRRPSLGGGDPLEEITELLKGRAPLYGKAADVEVDTTEISPLEAAELILEKLSSRNGITEAG
jgi:shikimate kinase